MELMREQVTDVTAQWGPRAKGRNAVRRHQMQQALYHLASLVDVACGHQTCDQAAQVRGVAGCAGSRHPGPCDRLLVTVAEVISLRQVVLQPKGVRTER